MLEAIVTGIIQGIAEWLPISSEGLLVLVKVKFFNCSDSIDLIIRNVLLLHFGTFLAALVYFHRYIWSLLKASFNYRKAELAKKQVIKFLIIATLISGFFGYLLLEFFVKIDLGSETAGRTLTLLIGFLLLITAALQFKAPGGGYKKSRDLKTKDSVLLGLAQALAPLPGLSRSGLTVSALLLRKFDKTTALRLSFVMSLPIVLAGNILLNLNKLVISAEALVGLLCSFIFGLATISLLIKAARNINFGYFVLIFGVLTIISVFI